MNFEQRIELSKKSLKGVCIGDAFAIWCAAYNLYNFEEALWKAVSVLGDRDTICAIVGGIVVMSAPEISIPFKWIDSVEDFERSIFIN